MNKEAVIQTLSELLKEADPSAFANVTLEQLLETNEKLPLDSLASFELAVLLEEKLGVSIDDNEISSLSIPQKLIDIVVERGLKG